MASLTKGTTVTSSTVVTSQILHDLIELATVGNVTPGDISGNVRFLASQAAAPNGSLYPFWLDTNPQDPILRVFDRRFGIWVAVGPHRFEIPMLNTAATDLRHGAQVVAAPGPTFPSVQLGTCPSLNAVGFCQSSAASGSWVPVCVYGIGWALWASSYSGSGGLSYGAGLMGRGVPSGVVGTVAFPAASGVSGALFGMLLETGRSGNTNSLTAQRALIWPPRMKLGGW